MNKAEASQVLEAQLMSYRSQSYADLLKLVDESIKSEIRGASGATYQVQVQVFWDDRPEGNLRIMGSIDDGGWRAFSPLTDSFILAPDGSFVGG